MSELKNYNERNMKHALYILNRFLDEKGKYCFFWIDYNQYSLDLILVKYVDNSNYRGFVEKYILSTETPLKMGSEITKIHTLLFNIL